MAEEAPAEFEAKAEPPLAACWRAEEVVRDRFRVLIRLQQMHHDRLEVAPQVSVLVLLYQES